MQTYVHLPRQHHGANAIKLSPLYTSTGPHHARTRSHPQWDDKHTLGISWNGQDLYIVPSISAHHTAHFVLESQHRTLFWLLGIDNGQKNMQSSRACSSVYGCRLKRGGCVHKTPSSLAFLVTRLEIGNEDAHARSISCGKGWRVGWRDCIGRGLAQILVMDRTACSSGWGWNVILFGAAPPTRHIYFVTSLCFRAMERTRLVRNIAQCPLDCHPHWY